jgi:WD40 repeat protein
MWWWMWAAWAAEEPVLRVELGMHTAMIRDLDTDAQGRFLVSGSHDKTARVWDGCTGELLRVLRPPIGEDNVGLVYSVAISPDGATVAVGGWMQKSGGKVYLFDRATGEVRTTISGLDNVTFSLAWSPDGALLAIGQSSGGLRVQKADGTLAWRDAEVTGAVYGLAWHPQDGRLAVTSHDDQLRLYDRAGRRLAQVQAGAADPINIAWSPDGAQLVMGYNSRARVELRDGPTLALLRTLSDGTDERQGLSSVAWTRDGQVVAGGTAYSGVTFPVRRYAAVAGVPADALPVGTDTVVDLLPMPGRRAGCRVPSLVVANGEPRLVGVQEGTVVQLREPPILDLRDVDLRLLPNRAAWLAAPRYGNPAGWRALGPGADGLRLLDAPSADAVGPLRAVAGHTVADWKNTAHPSLDGRALPLEDEYEMSRALAWRHDGTALLLATDWYLRPFTAAGGPLPSRPIDVGAWETAWTADDRLIVTAHFDGTLRWYHPDTLQTLLTAFVHRDGRRWVAWTPSGYYDSSPDGEDLFGWHVPRGPEQSADFFDAGHFRQRQYRPDVVALILQTRDEAAAVDRADKARGLSSRPPDPRQSLPPVVTVLAPEHGQVLTEPVALVQVRLRSPSGRPVERLRVWANSVPLEQVAIAPALDPTRVPDGDLHTLRVPVQGDTTLLVTAGADGTWSEPAAVFVRGLAGQNVVRPALHVLAVGIEGFANANVTSTWGLARLQKAEDDAEHFADWWQGQGAGDQRLYARAQVQVLTGRAATRAGVLDSLYALKQRVVQGDVVIVYLSGHGMIPPGDTAHYLLPWDADPVRSASTWLRLDEVEHVFDQLPARTLMFFDLCHAGVRGELATTNKGGADSDTQRLIAALSSADHGTVVFSATGRNSYAQELHDGGAFTLGVLQCLDDPKLAVDEWGGITIDRLGACMTTEVNRLTGGVQKALYQKPTIFEDFPVARPPSRLQSP